VAGKGREHNKKGGKEFKLYIPGKCRLEKYSYDGLLMGKKPGGEGKRLFFHKVKQEKRQEMKGDMGRGT